MYLWRSLCTLCLLAWEVRVNVGGVRSFSVVVFVWRLSSANELPCLLTVQFSLSCATVPCWENEWVDQKALNLPAYDAAFRATSSQPASHAWCLTSDTGCFPAHTPRDTVTCCTFSLDSVYSWRSGSLATQVIMAPEIRAFRPAGRKCCRELCSTPLEIVSSVFRRVLHGRLEAKAY